MRATPRGSDPERRWKVSTVQMKKDVKGSVIKHTCSGEGVIADKVMIGSCRHTLSRGGVTANEGVIGSYGRTLYGGGLIADEVTIGSCREGPTADAVTIGSCRS
jgi:hypothetical protein